MTASTTQLQLYNKALKYLGERKLATLSDAQESRRYLDDEYADVCLLCLRNNLWAFALTNAAPSTDSASGSGYTNKFAKPADWVRTAWVSTSSTIDPPLHDYLDQAGYWYANTTTLYVRYVGSTAGLYLPNWPADFAEYVAVSLARAIAPRITQDEALIERIEKQSQTIFERAVANDAKDGPPVSWPSTYAIALRYLGDKQFATIDQMLQIRRFMDDEYTRTVNFCLRNGVWNFATKSTSISSVAGDAGSGYSYKAQKPADWIRTSWVSSASSYDPPLNDYADQGGYILSNIATIYLRYVSGTSGAVTASWPADFNEYVAVSLARAIAPRVGLEGDAIAALAKTQEEFLERAVQNDLRDAPPVPMPATFAIALRYLGERGLVAPEKQLQVRRFLDDEYTRTVNICLRNGLWNFAMKSTGLSCIPGDPNSGYLYQVAKPIDWVRTSWVSASGTYDPPLRDYIDQGGYLHSNEATLYLRYVSSTLGVVTASWPADFLEYVAISLAKAVAPRVALDLDAIKSLNEAEQAFLERARIQDTRDNPAVSMPALYQIALKHLGERGLVVADKQMEIRRYMDDGYNDALEQCARSGLWNFAMRAIKIDSDSSIEPAFGYNSAFPKPTDWIRTSLISTTEVFNPPLRDYQDQNGYWLCNTDTLYARYVSSDLIANTDAWPPDFKEYVAVVLARIVAPRILEPAMVQELERREKIYWKRAQANDAMDQPPSPWPIGTWVSNRIRRGVLPGLSNNIRYW